MWQEGKNACSIVDAAMRELRQTECKHDRTRRIVGSFLAKSLRLHWYHGERWFCDCLVDAYLASNSASGQWIAGCGAEAAPYFRILNSVTQGEKFDPDGRYVYRELPELAKLPIRYLHKPWAAPQKVLTTTGISPGNTHPRPIVDFSESSKVALAAFAALDKNR